MRTSNIPAFVTNASQPNFFTESPQGAMSPAVAARLLPMPEKGRIGKTRAYTINTLATRPTPSAFSKEWFTDHTKALMAAFCQNLGPNISAGAALLGAVNQGILHNVKGVAIATAVIPVVPPVVDFVLQMRDAEKMNVLPLAVGIAGAVSGAMFSVASEDPRVNYTATGVAAISFALAAHANGGAHAAHVIDQRAAGESPNSGWLEAGLNNSAYAPGAGAEHYPVAVRSATAQNAGVSGSQESTENATSPNPAYMPAALSGARRRRMTF